ncbi:MAG: porin family protein [Treponema sp.]|jgi:hypothetical protein|nr:porin family protein [Treponema sp.]
MIRKGFLRAAVFAALFTGLTAAASAQVTVSGGFALSSVEAKGMTEGDMHSEPGFGGNIFVDYLLPINIPLSLGFEFGYDTGSLKNSQYGIEITGVAIPILARAAYHFDLMANLDLYLVGKVGYVLGSGTQKYGTEESTEEGINGMGFGVDVGAAFYFNSRFGIFAEAGFERYNLEKEVTGYDYKEDYGGSYYSVPYSYTLEFPFSRFVIVGISAKF